MQTFIDQLKSSFLTQFPNGYCNIGVQKGGLMPGTIGISIGLVGDLDVVSNGIRENDPMMHKFLIFNKNGVLSAELCHGSLKVKPTSKYYAMESVKTGFRKTTGDQAKLLRMYTKFFSKLKNTVIEQGDNIYKSDIYQDYI